MRKAYPGLYLFSVREKLNNLIVEYGVIGLVVYLTSTALVYLGFWLALLAGWDDNVVEALAALVRSVGIDMATPSGAAGAFAFWSTGYFVAKVTQPFRIAGTILVTPFLVRTYERITGKRLKRNTPTAVAD